jgi:hypothetical protein
MSLPQNFGRILLVARLQIEFPVNILVIELSGSGGELTNRCLDSILNRFLTGQVTI